MKRAVELGSLRRGRRFHLGGRKFQVCWNLGPAGVAVRSLVKQLVRLRGRTFQACDRTEQVWSAATIVTIEVRACAK